jgi:CBS domain-containing protein
VGALLPVGLARRAFTASFTDVGLRRSKSGSDRPSRKGVEKTRPAAKPIRITESSRRTYCVIVRAEDLDEKFPVVNIDSDALDAVRLLAEHRLNGLVVVTDTSETPYAVLPASQVVRFIVPGYVQDDPGLASVLTESMADHAAEKLSGKTIRDVLPKQRQHIPVADGDDTIIEVAEVMARLRSPLVAVVKDGRLHGVITASRLLSAALNDSSGNPVAT